MTTSPFDDTVAVVTGGAGGIGQAIVDALTDRGARVAVLDLRPPARSALAIACDMADAGAVEQAARRVAAELGPPGHLVCAAGVVSEYPLAALEPGEWRRVLDVSLTGTYLVTRALIPGMQERGSGSVVALSSGYGTMGYRHGGHYAASKAGIEAYIKSIALEVAGDGVRANVVASGPVLTEFVRHIPDFDQWRQDREARIPLGRIAEAGDLVGPVLFLLGPDSGYVTGQVLHVNGGLLMP